jgi:hypothetical protein
MKHPVLDEHAVIAWDMDSTLVNGPNSAFFRSYILAHPEKRHVVITHRTPRAWAQRESFCQPEKVAAFLAYKGMQAKSVGATVLIDDMHTTVEQGCIDHGVTFIHALGDFPIITDADTAAKVFQTS